MAAENTQPTSTTAPTEQQPAAPAVAPPTTPAASPTPEQAKPAAPTAPATPAAPAAAQKTEDSVTLPREAFNARIASAEQAAQRKVWESLGKSEDEIKTLLAAEAARVDAQKSLEQRMAERDAELAAERAKANGYLQTLSERCELEMGLLSDAQKAAVVKLGGDDPAKRLAALDALWPTWNSESAKPQAQEAAVSQQATAKPAIPAPVSPVDTATAPDPNAPGDGSPTSPPDHKSIYRDLKSRNPFEAAEYARLHPDVWDGMVR